MMNEVVRCEWKREGVVSGDYEDKEEKLLALDLKRSGLKCSGKQPRGSLSHKVAVLVEKLWDIFLTFET